jgi:2-methylisocitrate lyase-like PEP mutase family enzyme
MTPSAAQRAAAFADLHVKGAPLVLFNVWDAGSARAVAEAGAKAIATGSLSVAAAQGYADGQALPLDHALLIAERIVASVDLPVTIDFEGAYAQAPDEVEENLIRLRLTGAVGCNFEDQIVGEEGIYDIMLQQARIAGARQGGGAAFFLNARTDLFLKQRDRARHGELIGEAIERAQAYAEAGASGFFAPGLVDPDLIARLCAATRLPVNVIRLAGAPEVSVLAQAGVARVSYGPAPYREMIAGLTQAARAALG